MAVFCSRGLRRVVVLRLRAFLFFFIYHTDSYLQIEYAEQQQGLETTLLESLVSYAHKTKKQDDGSQAEG